MNAAHYRPRSRSLIPLFLGTLLAAGCQFFLPHSGGSSGSSGGTPGSSDGGTPGSADGGPGSTTGCSIDLRHEAVIEVTGNIKSLPQSLYTDDPMEVTFQSASDAVNTATTYIPGFGPPTWVSLVTKTPVAGSHNADPFYALHLVIVSSPSGSPAGSTPFVVGMTYGFGMGSPLDTGQFVLESATATGAVDPLTVSCPHWLGTFNISDMTMAGNADAGFVVSGMALSYQASCSATGEIVAGCASLQ